MTIVSGTYCLPMGGKGTSGNLKIEVVSALPAMGRVDRVYFVPIEGATGDNQYTEYIWDKDRQRFEEVGPREIDLTPYATKEALSAVEARVTTAEAEIVVVQGDVAALDADVADIRATKQDTLSAGSAIEIEDNTVGVAVFDKSKFTVVGSPVISADGVASGFSSSAYLTLPIIFQPSNKKWEIDFKITPNRIDTHNDFFGSSSGTDYKHIGLGVASNGKFALFLSSNGTSWDISSNRGGTTSIETGTLYYLKLIYNGTSYKLYSSTNNIDWITEISIDNSNAIYQNTVVQSLGINKVSSSNYYPFTGSIDLNAFKIYIGGEQVLSGAKTLYQALDAKQDVLTAGNNITIEDGVISATGGGSGSGSGTTLTSADGATTYSELALGETLAVIDTSTKELNGLTQTGGTLNSELEFTGASGASLKMTEKYDLATADSWEFQTKYKHNGGGSYPTIFGYASGSDFKTPSLLYQDSRLVLYLSSSGGSWNINTSNSGLSLVSGTIYYFKVGFTGSQYYVKYNTTGWSDEFTTQWTKSSTTKVYCSDYFMFMNLSLNSNYYNTGTMYLQDTALIVNGSEVWRGANITPGLLTLNANLDELGNEVNTLASAVSANEAGIAKLKSDKQDIIKSGKSVSLNLFYPDALENVYEHYNYSSGNFEPIENPSNYTVSHNGLNRVAYIPDLWSRTWTATFKIPLVQYLGVAVGGIQNDNAPNLLDAYPSIYINNITDTSIQIRCYADKYITISDPAIASQGFMYLKFVKDIVSDTDLASAGTIYYSKDRINYTAISQPLLNKPYFYNYNIAIGATQNGFTSAVVDLTEIKFEYTPARDPYYVVDALPATTSSLGVVKPDGTTVTVDDAGVISATPQIDDATPSDTKAYSSNKVEDLLMDYVPISTYNELLARVEALEGGTA